MANPYHRPVAQRQWVKIREFPDWEISPDGVIRQRYTKVVKATYEDPRGYSCVQFRKDKARFTRTVLSLTKKAWPENYIAKKE